MSVYNAARIEKPKHFRVGPLRSGRGNRPPYIIGFDSEAEKGRPFLFQFAHPSGRVDLIDVDGNYNKALSLFLHYLAQHCYRKDVEYIVFGFNLNYEYTQIFAALSDETKSSPEFIVNAVIDTPQGDEKFRVRAMNDKRYSFTVEMLGTKRRVKVVDAMAFLPTSLNEAGKIIDAGEKMPKPEHFERKYRNTLSFIAYAEQDARLTQKLGEYIMGLHAQYDVRTCISSPHFAARVFRRKYMRADLDSLTNDLEQIGLDSYHGGKNGYYLTDPAHYKKIYNYDITSAYPEAMAALPNPEESEWQLVGEYKPGVHAIWRALIRYTGCKYEPIYTHDNKRLLPTNRKRKVTITSYELDAALECGCVELLSCTGYIMDGPKGGPLFEYVKDFFAMKRDAKSPAERTTAKLFLNSLYGKFFQKVPLGTVGVWDFDTEEFVMTNPEQDYDFQAGGLYHPPIASLITGFVRAKIHRLEHKYNAIMTSTDGFFAENPPDEKDLGKSLGLLTVAVGSLRIWRERLYVFTEKGTHKRKYALHGFRGKVAELLRIPLARGAYTYAAQQMITLKMSIRAYRGIRYTPGEFATMEFTLDLRAPP